MNIFDKLKLPFAKKVKQVPVSWVEEGPEHYYVIHHLLFGYRTIDDNSARAASLYFGYCRPV